MDDLGQVVCDEADLRRALARVCSWLYEHGHEISPKKLVLAALAGAAGFQFTFEWRPSVEECADAARREAAKVKLAVEVKIAIQRVDGPSLAMLTHPSNQSFSLGWTRPSPSSCRAGYLAGVFFATPRRVPVRAATRITRLRGRPWDRHSGTTPRSGGAAGSRIP